MSKVAKVTNLQYLLRNSRLDCYDLSHAGRLILRLNLDYLFRLAQQIMSLVVTIIYFCDKSLPGFLKKIVK